MDKFETQSLQEELNQFRAEKEKIKNLIGSIGGTTSARRDRIFNICFIITIIIIFILDTLRHLWGVNIYLPPLFSIEIGLLLVSIKIIWMIHKQTKVEHFQFWILNSIEFRINDISKKLSIVEKALKDNPDQYHTTSHNTRETI